VQDKDRTRKKYQVGHIFSALLPKSSTVDKINVVLELFHGKHYKSRSPS